MNLFYLNTRILTKVWDICIMDIKNITIKIAFLNFEWTTYKDAEVTLNNKIGRQQ